MIWFGHRHLDVSSSSRVVVGARSTIDESSGRTSRRRAVLILTTMGVMWVTMVTRRWRRMWMYTTFKMGDGEQRIIYAHFMN